MHVAIQTGPLARNNVVCLRAHDLLRLRQAPFSENAPAWLSDAFARAPYAVVRRAEAGTGFVAIGLRGATRAQRYGTYVEHVMIEAVHSPETLAPFDPAGQRSSLPAFAALRSLRNAGCFGPLDWGPTGSTGFELATGLPSVTESSDLDLLVRAPCSLPREAARALHAVLQSHAARANVRIDVQLETPLGGVALGEWATGKARVMLRGTLGPRLITDPWALDDSTQRDPI